MMAWIIFAVIAAPVVVFGLLGYLLYHGRESENLTDD